MLFLFKHVLLGVSLLVLKKQLPQLGRSVLKDHRFVNINLDVKNVCKIEMLLNK